MASITEYWKAVSSAGGVNSSTLVRLVRLVGDSQSAARHDKQRKKKREIQAERVVWSRVCVCALYKEGRTYDSVPGYLLDLLLILLR